VAAAHVSHPRLGEIHQRRTK